MKVYLSGLEASGEFDYINSKFRSYKYMLMSFYYIRERPFTEILKKSESVLIDSGAHSFQKGKKVDWEEYTKEYARFIRKNDNPKIVGYFEMDVDNIIGYERVLKLRKILESVTDKIIPVWHRGRGIDDFIKMCEKYKGKWIAVTGFKNEDIVDEQYSMFLRTAWRYGCKLHCLGMTRKKILDRVPFDSVDSSSWKQESIYGRVGRQRISKVFSKTNRADVMVANLRASVLKAESYRRKWRNYEK